ncbi:hypothetical protein KUTeg_016163 [Tegillarca granosa]|uniref:DDE Tnp4 domain-containing protein n=1 Tax=Tegillarca granosa TaxID=220873 RepID=A0ABQ9ENQ7_TEGGR|nr:hypothetical protein KUTeg_016112 [Tegillarca granosa]KAJ8305618.1 hypothetical protein KUTeg_016163 [Tegillarca granosa]
MAAYLRLTLSNNQQIRKKREFRRQHSFFSDEEHRRRYRFGKEGIQLITSLVREDVENSTKRSRALTVEEQVLLALRFYASGNFLQVIGDTMGKFTNISAQWPGSSHDSHIFRSSQARTYMEQHGGFDRGIILGDAGYPCKPFLMTPYRCADTPQKQLFNNRHCKTRCMIERAFGVWKRRFHVLHSEIRMKPTKVCKIIIACAVLHNIAIELKEPLIDADDEYVELEQPNVEPYYGREEGNRIRDHYANTFFNANV